MTGLMTSLVLLAYGTAAVVGIQLVASSASHLFTLVGRRPWGPDRYGEVSPTRAALADVVLMLAGLFLLLQGVVVVLWTFE